MAGEAWHLEGTVVIACNCDYGCPCNFNALPTQGYCEGGWTWIADSGSFGSLSLAGLAFSLYCKWPGAIHEGGGKALALVDEEADESRRDAVRALVTGEAGGGPWGVIGWTYELVGPVRPVRYDVVLGGIESRIRAGEELELVLEPIRNPVTGAEVNPGVVLPEGIITKRADLGSSRVFRLRDGIAYDHSGQYVAVGPFDYAGP
jgi:hypothetical protein